MPSEVRQERYVPAEEPQDHATAQALFADSTFVSKVGADGQVHYEPVSASEATILRSGDTFYLGYDPFTVLGTNQSVAITIP